MGFQDFKNLDSMFYSLPSFAKACDCYRTCYAFSHLSMQIVGEPINLIKISFACIVPSSH